MATYVFNPMVAVNPDVVGSVIINGSGKVYAPDDVNFTTPLPARRLSDNTLMTTITTNARGLTQAFRLDDHPSVVFRDDGAGGTAPVDAARGVIEDVLARAAVLEGAADRAEAAADNMETVTDAGMSTVLSNNGSQFHGLTETMIQDQLVAPLAGKVDAADLALGIRSTLLSGHGEIEGNDGKKYSIVAGALRCDGTWATIENGAHTAPGITAVTADSTQITLSYAGRGHAKICGFVVGPDETFASAGVTVGASVGNDQALIRFGGVIKHAAYISWTGTDWNIAGSPGISCAWNSTNGGQLMVTHPRLPVASSSDCADIQITPRASNLPVVDPDTSWSTVGVPVRIYSLAGSQYASPTTAVRFFFSHSTNARLDPTKLDIVSFPNSNIWFIAIFEKG